MKTQIPEPRDEADDGELSDFVPRGQSESSPDSSSNLPPAKDLQQLKLAAKDMVEQGLSLDDAAERYGVDADTLHVFYKTYVKSVGKENLPKDEDEVRVEPSLDFDRDSSRQIDRNYAQRKHEEEENRIPLSRSRQWLISSPLTRWMFNGEKLDLITITGVICALLLGGLALKSAMGGDTEEIDEEPPGETVAERLSEREVLQETLPGLIQFLDSYIFLDTWQERLPFVREREVVAPLMEKYYKQNPDGKIGALTIEADVSFLSRPDGYFAVMYGENSDGDRLTFMIELNEEEPKYLVDWQILENHEPVPLETFEKSRSREPAPFRVLVGKGDYYNKPFMDESEFYCFKLNFFNRDRAPSYGFVRRGTELGEKISNIVDGELDNYQAMMLMLRYPENAKFDNILEIESIVSGHW